MLRWIFPKPVRPTRLGRWSVETDQWRQRMDMASMDSCFMTIYKDMHGNDKNEKVHFSTLTATQHGQNDEQKERGKRQKR